MMRNKSTNLGVAYMTSVLAVFLMRSPILIELEFGDVDFCGEWKTRERGESPSEQDQIQQQTRTTYGTGPESNLGHIGALTTAPLRLPRWS